MRRFITYIIVAAGAMPLCAQSLFPTQSAVIEQANPSLRSLTVLSEAAVQEAHTGLSLDDPEVSVSYMLGVPSDVPNRTNIEVTQPFDFATLSGAKSRMASARSQVEKASLGVERATMMLELEKGLINYVYWLAMVRELERQHDRVHAMHEAAKAALDGGKITRLEYNRIALESLSADADLDMARTELASQAAELSVMAGGAQLVLPTAWPEASLPASFDDWASTAAAASPELRLMLARIDEAKAEVDMRRKQRMPDFSFGYTGELVRGANYHGAVLNFSLPLWGERGGVKAARAQQQALTLQRENVERQFLLTKRSQYDRACALDRACRAQAALYEEIEQTNEAYLRMALDSGTITILEYMTEQEDFYGHAMKYLETRRDFLLARAELYAETL